VRDLFLDRLASEGDHLGVLGGGERGPELLHHGDPVNPLRSGGGAGIGGVRGQFSKHGQQRDGDHADPARCSDPVHDSAGFRVDRPPGQLDAFRALPSSGEPPVARRHAPVVAKPS
jgi:hypothetical protein